MSTETTHLPDRALVLLARAGLDLGVLDTELKSARIEAAHNEEEEAA